MAVLVAKQLDDVPADTLAHALKELVFRQHHQNIPRERREEFIGICQAARDDMLGFRRFLEVPGADAEGDGEA
jgi:hypothetical protein